MERSRTPAGEATEGSGWEDEARVGGQNRPAIGRIKQQQSFLLPTQASEKWAPESGAGR